MYAYTNRHVALSVSPADAHMHSAIVYCQGTGRLCSSLRPAASAVRPGHSRQPLHSALQPACAARCTELGCKHAREEGVFSTTVQTCCCDTEVVASTFQARYAVVGVRSAAFRGSLAPGTARSCVYALLVISQGQNVCH